MLTSTVGMRGEIQPSATSRRPNLAAAVERSQSHVVMGIGEAARANYRIRNCRRGSILKWNGAASAPCTDESPWPHRTRAGRESLPEPKSLLLTEQQGVLSARLDGLPALPATNP